MEIIHIDELLFPIGLGNTEPCMGIANGKQVVIKFLNNIEGNKSLINEYVCYQIAKKLDILMPESGLCLIDNNTKISSNVSQGCDFGEQCYGIGFYSTWIPNVTKVNSEKLIRLSDNYETLLPKLLLFDHLIFNKDRNPGNIMIGMSKSNKNLYVIDHTHTFNLQCIWTGFSLRQLIDNDFLSTDILEYNEYLYKFFYKCLDFDLIKLNDIIEFFKERLNKEFFDDIMNKIPLEWEKNKDELTALSEYINYRFGKLNDFAYLISSFKY